MKVINGIGLAVHFEHQQFIHVAVAAIKELFHNPSDAFWTGKAMNLLFDGIKIDCSTKNPLAKVACGEMKSGDHQAIRQLDNQYLSFSLLGGVCFIYLFQFFFSFKIIIFE